MLTVLVYLKLFQLSWCTKSMQKLGLYRGAALDSAHLKYYQLGFSLFSLVILDHFLAKYLCRHRMFFKLVPLQNTAVKCVCSDVDCCTVVT